LEESRRFVEFLDLILATINSPQNICVIKPESYFMVCKICIERSYNIIDYMRCDKAHTKTIADIISTLILPQYIIYLKQYNAEPHYELDAESYESEEEKHDVETSAIVKKKIHVQLRVHPDLTDHNNIPLNFYAIFGRPSRDKLPIVTPVPNRPPPIFYDTTGD
jgi:hypothetical protein